VTSEEHGACHGKHSDLEGSLANENQCKALSARPLHRRIIRGAGRWGKGYAVGFASGDPGCIQANAIGKIRTELLRLRGHS
jgi:hypothetical protein